MNKGMSSELADLTFIVTNIVVNHDLDMYCEFMCH